jgi:hypothetical protein
MFNKEQVLVLLLFVFDFDLLRILICDVCVQFTISDDALLVFSSASVDKMSISEHELLARHWTFSALPW